MTYRMKTMSMMMTLAIIVVTTMTYIQEGVAQTSGATIIGRVTFHGPLPPPTELEVNIDQHHCGKTITSQPLHVTQGAVRDTVVSIGGPTTRTPGIAMENTTPAIHVLTNRQCVFVSRIGIARVGDLIEIQNDDPLMHNTHIRLGETTMVNVVIVKQGRPIRKQIQTPGMFEVKCDKHKFMQGYVLAYDHPYVSMTDTAGRFEIRHVPAGSQNIRIWHETLGVLEKTINVPPTGEISVDFEYPRTAAVR